MSVAEAERFVEDLSNNAELLAETKGEAAGLASVVEFAQAKGYDFNIDEAKAFINSKSPQELTDQQLDAIAGGKSSKDSSVHTSSNVEQSTDVATTGVSVAEGAADVAIGVSAVLVVVLT